MSQVVLELGVRHQQGQFCTDVWLSELRKLGRDMLGMVFYASQSVKTLIKLSKLELCINIISFTSCLLSSMCPKCWGSNSIILHKDRVLIFLHLEYRIMHYVSTRLCSEPCCLVLFPVYLPSILSFHGPVSFVYQGREDWNSGTLLTLERVVPLDNS